MEPVGITVDVPVSNSEVSEAFYTVVLGRKPDRGAASALVEWIVHREPEIAIRLAAGRAVDPDRVRVGFAVAELDHERRRLADTLPDVPPISTRPGVIAELTLRDPDGYRVVLWQDMLAW
jgi:hypothetical protein